VPIVLSHAAWQAHYHADPAIVGRSMTLNGRPAMVIGVMPPGFFADTPRPDTTEAWLPLTLEPLVQGRKSLLGASDSHWLYVVGRLHAGPSPTVVSAKTTATLRQWLPANLPLTSATHRVQRSLVPLDEVKLADLSHSGREPLVALGQL
jgi:macrolide transport system ATP-binding/permease protein